MPGWRRSESQCDGDCPGRAGQTDVLLEDDPYPVPALPLPSSGAGIQCGVPKECPRVGVCGTMETYLARQTSDEGVLLMARGTLQRSMLIENVTLINFS